MALVATAKTCPFSTLSNCAALPRLVDGAAAEPWLGEDPEELWLDEDAEELWPNPDAAGL